MRGKRNAFWICLWNLNYKVPAENLGVDVRIILNLAVNKHSEKGLSNWSSLPTWPLQLAFLFGLIRSSDHPVRSNHNNDRYVMSTFPHCIVHSLIFSNFFTLSSCSCAKLCSHCYVSQCSTRYVHLQSKVDTVINPKSSYMFMGLFLS
jgi:hypothetical protein